MCSWEPGCCIRLLQMWWWIILKMDRGECEWSSLSFGTDSSPAAYGCSSHSSVRILPKKNKNWTCSELRRGTDTKLCMDAPKTFRTSSFPPASLRVLELQLLMHICRLLWFVVSESRAVHVHYGISLLFLLWFQKGKPGSWSSRLC